MYWTELQCAVSVKLVLEVIQCYPFGAVARISTRMHKDGEIWFIQFPESSGTERLEVAFQTVGNNSISPPLLDGHTLNHAELYRLKNIQDSSSRSRWQHHASCCLLRRKSTGSEKNTVQWGTSALSQSTVSLPSSPGHRIGRRGGISQKSWEAGGEITSCCIVADGAVWLRNSVYVFYYVCACIYVVFLEYSDESNA